MMMKYKVEEVLFDTFDNAKECLDEMKRQIKEYGRTTVCDYYDLVFVTPEYTDSRCGWVNLDKATVRGKVWFSITADINSRFLMFYIDLPEPEAIDKKNCDVSLEELDFSNHTNDGILKAPVTSKGLYEFVNNFIKSNDCRIDFNTCEITRDAIYKVIFKDARAYGWRISLIDQVSDDFPLMLVNCMNAVLEKHKRAVSDDH